ncbi:HemY protein [Devosia enhydra]|uniref:HemY protein n=1 Tax=Devosia enhydra TaxID=665118 RepID=A0A1K2HZM8_9HYPH|nr:heme biosynthesis HemY N-terminal domain-containing protein [Devosia enhydra]SFZ85387.1 HemY protein [Devosia enhydra]
MIRLALWIVFSLVVAAGIAWLIGLPGTMTLEVAGYRMQPRLGVAAAVSIGLIALTILVWTIVRRVIDAPRHFARMARERRRERAMVALSDGFIALSAGDAHRARRLARDARSSLPENAAAQLLEAKADLALGNMHAAREHYRALIADRRTALAALSGLYEQARAQGRHDAALTFAQKAVAIAPAPWASEAVLDDLTRRGQWQAALDHLSAEPAVSREDKMRKRRKQALIETARAREAEPSEPLRALDHALAALKLLPDFVPAALIAARIQSNRGEARRAMSLLRRVWRATSHPDIAALYAAAVPGASAVDRLKRVTELIDQPPPNRAAAIVLARAAVDAFEWSTARNALAPYVSSDATQALCLLMAEIEEGQSGDHGKAREWLSRAVRAPRDPTWTADGLTAEEWEPVSPVTGKLDAFEWRVPIGATGLQRSPAPVAPPSGTTVAVPAGDATGSTALALSTR